MKRCSALLFCLLLSPLALRGGAAAPAVAAEESPKALRDRAEALMRKDKKSAEPWILMGRAALAEKRDGKALSAFKKALKYDAHAAEAYYWRGRIFEKRGKVDEAANEYQAARRADPGHAGAKEALSKLSVSEDASDK